MPTLDLEKSKKLKRGRKAKLLKLLGGKCIKCGETESLEFDHIDPGTMSFRIGHRLDYSMELLKKEADKCQLLCHRCHWSKTLSERNQEFAVHGSHGMYTNHGCRCDLCKEANTNYARSRTRMSKNTVII